ncbi:MAG: hypothetical protein BGO67_05125 [Alphaproteobacteria bacterium 41-28]|nr:MAG: hypothetical protein BGO67_05125 [Alphaproteobacteria bacterium 41-28]
MVKSLAGTVSHSGPGFVVIDNFLTSEEHQLVWNYIQQEALEFVHQKKWVKAFRLTDGELLWGPPYLSDPYAPDTKNQVYPTHSGIDLVIKKVKELAPGWENLIGKQGEDWAYFFARAYIYPSGAGLSWHRDNENSARGAYVYYAHPDWDPQWGGEFLIAPYETKDLKYPTSTLYHSESKYLGSHLESAFEKEALLEHSVGTYILPKPNRLVIISSGIIHCIKKVENAAGNKVRATIQGFFQDPTGLLRAKK